MDDYKGNWREEIGNPETVGDLRRMLRTYGNSVRLAVRNAPLPKLYSLGVDGHPYLEIEIPDIPKRQAEQSGKGGGK
jgi:hypothetical protein